MAEKMPKLERRELLKVFCGAGASAVCASVGGCGAAGMMGSGEELVQLPAVVEGRVVLPLAEFPQLAEVGGGIVGEARGMVEPLAIARESENKFFAMRAVCTHMTCTLRYNRLSVSLDCPCHGSTFEMDGTVINGPAVKPLGMLSTEFDGQVVRILLGS
jgi:Rieske Fe-S protein